MDFDNFRRRYAKKRFQLYSPTSFNSLISEYIESFHFPELIELAKKRVFLTAKIESDVDSHHFKVNMSFILVHTLKYLTDEDNIILEEIPQEKLKLTFPIRRRFRLSDQEAREGLLSVLLSYPLHEFMSRNRLNKVLNRVKNRKDIEDLETYHQEFKGKIRRVLENENRACGTIKGFDRIFEYDTLTYEEEAENNVIFLLRSDLLQLLELSPLEIFYHKKAQRFCKMAYIDVPPEEYLNV